MGDPIVKGTALLRVINITSVQTVAKVSLGQHIAQLYLSQSDQPGAVSPSIFLQYVYRLLTVLIPRIPNIGSLFESSLTSRIVLVIFLQVSTIQNDFEMNHQPN